MRRSNATSLLLGVLGFLLPNSGQAQPPGINTVFPPAVQKGVESSVQFVGKNLEGTELVLPFQAKSKLQNSSAGVVRFLIEPAKDVVPGVYPVRVRTDRGISNLRLIQVTDVPVIPVQRGTREYKNGRIQLEEAQPISWPAVVAGDRLNADADLLRFDVSAGQRLTLVTQTRRLGLTPDPVLWLRDSKGRKLRYAHDTPGLRADERLDHTFNSTGDYYIELQSFGTAGWNNHYLLRIDDRDYVQTVFPLGGRRGEKISLTIINRDGKPSTMKVTVPDDPWRDHWHLPLPKFPASLPWRLAMGDLPEVMEDDKKDNAEPQPIEWPVTVNGRIAEPREGDRYRISVTPGEPVRVTVEAFYLGSQLDGYLMVYDPKAQKLLAKADDQRYRGNPDPGLMFQAPAGTEEVVIELRDTLGRGGLEFPYRLTVEPGGEDFSLCFGNVQSPSTAEGKGWDRMDAADTLNLNPGQPVKLKISALRPSKEGEGYQGPIRVKAMNVPKGVTIAPGTIAAGATETELICTADESAPRDPFEVVIVGEGTDGKGRTIRRIAERKLYLSDPQMPHLHWNWRLQKLTCVVTRK